MTSFCHGALLATSFEHLAQASLILWLLGLAAAITVGLGNRYLDMSKRLLWSPVHGCVRTVKRLGRALMRAAVRRGKQFAMWTGAWFFHRLRRW